MATPFLELKEVSLRVNGNQVLDRINLTVHRNQQWAIAGHSGSGKTALVHAIAGKQSYIGQINYHFPAKRNHKSTIVLVEQQHRFRNLSNTGELYYQQRFNSYDAEQTLTVRQALQQHFGDQRFLHSQWMNELHLNGILDEPLIQLSNGENKRVQLFSALLDEPELLILDNPFIGLDEEGRQTLPRIIGAIAKKGIQVIYTLSHFEIPDGVTHIACIQEGKLVNACERSEFRLADKERYTNDPMDSELLDRLKPLDILHFRSAIKMNHVNVRYGSKQILQDISWEVKKGERWSLSGANGAGKSTLLSLVTADNPQAYANEIYLFDRRRGSGESIWDIKRQIGFVSPELHLYFDFGATCFEVVASGLFDTVGLFRHLNEQQEKQVLLWLELFQLGHLRAKRLSQIAMSEQRKALLARALIKAPPLLILDEPCQGLDDGQTAYLKTMIDGLCAAFDMTLVYVSHYQQEIPVCVTRFLRLDKGCVVPGNESF